MKAPQVRKTAKRIEGEDRNGYAPITLDGSEDNLTISELNERKDVVILRSEDEIRTLKEFCEAWLDENNKE